jgi:diguanylate cyclase (GGDEF)-like protein
MGIRGRTLAWMSVVLCLALSGGFAYNASIVRREVEAEEERDNAERARAAGIWVEDATRSLLAHSRDYARWDNTWAFTHGGAPKYLVDDWNAGSWASQDVDLVVIGRADEVVFARRRPVDGAEPDGASDDELAAIRPLMTRSDERTGLLSLDGDAWVYVVTPVLRTDGSGGDGTVWASLRRLDDRRLALISRMASSAVGLLPPSAMSPPVDRAHESYAVPLDVGETAGWRLSVTRPSEVHARVLQRMLVLAVDMLVAGGAVLLASLALVDRLVLRRIVQLSEQAREIRPGDVGRRLAVSADDEFDHLSEAFNALLDGVAARDAKLQHDSMHDVLTGLGNRALLHDRLERALARSERAATPGFALLFIDLDRLKMVNDLLGHDMGDRLIAEIGRRIRAAVRSSDTVARLGGDEFAVVLEDTSSALVGAQRAQRLLAAIREPFDFGTQTIHMTASVGVTLPSIGSTVASLLKEADTAMYAAKQAGRDGWSVYDEVMHGRVLHRLETERCIRRGLDQGEFEPWFQPIVGLPGGRTKGFEALARWRHPERGWVQPDEFIPVAEESRLIGDLDAALLEKAVAQFAPWVRARPDLFLCVNQSARRFEAPDLEAHVASLIRRYGLPDGALVLEVTETQFGRSEDRWSERIARLSELGVRVALDDFGSGYSSLMRLRTVPVGMLKLDRAFVVDLAAGNGALARAVLQLALELGLPVIAEGVEDLVAHRALVQSGCAYAQGFGYARPMSGPDVSAWMRLAEARRTAEPFFLQSAK